MTKIKSWIQPRRRSIGIIVAGAGLAAAVLLLNIGSLIRGLSTQEYVLQQQYGTLSAIAHNPVGLPLLLIHWVIGLWAPLSAVWMRIPSVLIAGVALAAMAYILRRWYGFRTALFGYLLFVCSAWLLHVGRLASMDIVYLLVVPLVIFAHVLLHNNPSSRLAVYAWISTHILLLYIPGGVWFVLLNIWLQRDEMPEAFETFRFVLGRAVLIFFGVILLAPLAVGLILGNTKQIGLDLVGLPSAVPSISQFGQSLADSFLFIAVRGTAPDSLWLNHLPILDAFLTVAFLAGVYFYAKHLRANRSKLLFGSLLLGIILASSGGPATVGLIVPLLFLIAAAGIAYLLHLWLAVFPRNPLARGVGVAMVFLVVLASCTYGLRQYFVAWPHHEPAQVDFSQREIIRTRL